MRSTCWTRRGAMRSTARRRRNCSKIGRPKCRAVGFRSVLWGARQRQEVPTMTSSVLKPAAELAKTNIRRVPNESAEYRRARQALLVEEIELRRHVARVAELRRALPPGGEVVKAYEFVGAAGKASLAELFGDKQTLIIYSYMFGPQR